MAQGPRKEASLDIEGQWFVRVREAQAQYQRAAKDHGRMVEELDKAPSEPVAGSYTVAKAHRAVAQALDELLRCQQVVVDLVLRRDIPDEDEKRLI